MTEDAAKCGIAEDAEDVADKKLNRKVTVEDAPSEDDGDPPLVKSEPIDCPLPTANLSLLSPATDPVVLDSDDDIKPMNIDVDVAYTDELTRTLADYAEDDAIDANDGDIVQADFNDDDDDDEQNPIVDLAGTAEKPPCDETRDDTEKPESGEEKAEGLGGVSDGDSEGSDSEVPDETPWDSAKDLIAFRSTAGSLADDFLESQGIKLKKAKGKIPQVILRNDSARRSYKKGKEDAERIDVRRRRILDKEQDV